MALDIGRPKVTSKTWYTQATIYFHFGDWNGQTEVDLLHPEGLALLVDM